MLGGHREVAEAEAQWYLAQLPPATGAIWTSEIGVDDRFHPLPGDVIVRADRRDGSAGEIAHPGDGTGAQGAWL